MLIKNLTGRAKLAYEIFGIEYFLTLFAVHVGVDLNIKTFINGDKGTLIDGEFHMFDDMTRDRELLAISGIRLKKSGKNYKLELVYCKPIDEDGRTLQVILDYHHPEKRDKEFISKIQHLSEVASIILQELWKDNSFELSEIITGYKIWKDIEDKVGIRNGWTLIAAIKSILGQLRMEPPNYSHYAKQYGLSASSVSQKSKDIVKFLKIKMCDPRYIDEDPMPIMKAFRTPKPLLGSRTGRYRRGSATFHNFISEFSNLFK